jgi:hypothetical protein
VKVVVKAKDESEKKAHKEPTSLSIGLIGEQLDRVGHIEAKCPGRLQVESQTQIWWTVRPGRPRVFEA